MEHVVPLGQRFQDAQISKASNPGIGTVVNLIRVTMPNLGL
jgi:hypothetical protein